MSYTETPLDENTANGFYESSTVETHKNISVQEPNLRKEMN